MKTIVPIHPTSVLPPAPELSQADRFRLQSVVDSIAICDGKCTQINGLKDIVKQAAAAFADGRIPLESAISLAGILPANVPAVRTALRGAIKSHARAMVQDCRDVLVARREQIAADLAARCAAMETTERKGQIDAGIHADLYAPSPTLLSLREQADRAKRAIPLEVTRLDLSQLCQAAGIVPAECKAPPVEYEDDLSDLAAILELDTEPLTEAGA